jgi:hypothetical protein
MAVVGTVISAVSAVAGTVGQMKASKKADKRARQAAEARREAADIQQAGGENVDRANRRRAIREERVRRGQIEQAAQGSGVSTNLGAAISGQAAGAKTAGGISAANQAASVFDASARRAISQGNLFSSVVTSVGGVAAGAAKSGLFDPAPIQTELKRPATGAGTGTSPFG